MWDRPRDFSQPVLLLLLLLLQVEGMAGERSRASFLLQLGLRAIATGNTGVYGLQPPLFWLLVSPSQLAS